MAAHTTLSPTLDDLRSVATWPGPFFSVILPARSDVTDPDHRLAVRWSNASRELSPEWSDEQIAELDELVGSIGHDGGAALAIVHSAGGRTLTEFLPAAPAAAIVLEGGVPALVPIIEGRQRALPHVVVETDKSGADIVAFAGTTVVATDRVAGEELHIHRGHPGGWSQQRFQQRAENTWNDNAADVAEAVAALAERVGARLIAVAGPTRAQSMVAEAVAERTDAPVAKVEAGDADGIAAEVVTLLDDAHASAVVAVAERLRERLGTGSAVVGVDATLGALVEGRVDTLLVNDDWSDTTELDQQLMDIEPGARAIDAAVVAALRTEADIVVVPSLAVMDGPLAAILRW